MISPFFVGMVADRFMATERILAALHVVGGAILFYASTQTTFGGVLHRDPALHAVLHADAGAEQLAVVPADEAIRGASFRRSACSARSAGSSPASSSARSGSRRPACRCRLPAPRSVLLGLFCLALPHTPPQALGTRDAARRPRPRRAEADGRAVVRDLRARIVSRLHPAAVLLRVREPVPERAAA